MTGDCGRRAAVFDYDGVLLIPPETPNPWAGLVLETLATWGCVVHVVSYRPQGDRGLVRSTLRQLGLPPHLIGALMLRPPGGWVGGELDWKKRAYNQLRNRGVEALLVSEDNPQALEIAGATWPNACLHYYTPDGKPHPYNPTPHCTALYHKLVHRVP